MGGAPGDSADEASTPLLGDHVPPRILSVTPANGAVGVKADAPIVISFSEPMDQRATLDAFASETLPRRDTTLTWNDAGTILTLQPNAPLEYAHATLEPGTSLELDAKQYGYTVTRFATDLAGNPLQETSVTFSTLREVKQTYAALPELTGVLPGAGNDAHFYGLVTFDADQLPAGIVTVEHAVMHSDPYVLGADVPLYHVRFSGLGPSALGAPGQLIETLPRSMTGDQVIPDQLTALLAPDYTGRSASYHYSQYRLQLPAGLTEGDVPAVRKLLVDVKIEAEYLLP